jgi:hypothetical protein
LQDIEKYEKKLGNYLGTGLMYILRDVRLSGDQALKLQV